jgi:hypothetical protein
MILTESSSLTSVQLSEVLDFVQRIALFAYPTKQFKAKFNQYHIADSKLNRCSRLHSLGRFVEVA